MKREGLLRHLRCYGCVLRRVAAGNLIDGKTHDGLAIAPVPAILGMNLQVVSVGQKLVEKSLGLTGGYTDPLGTPSAPLLSEIQFVDNKIGAVVQDLKSQNLYHSTWIIITAKHSQSPIDPDRVLCIPADNPSFEPPSAVLGGVGTGLPGGGLVGQALEDDISLLWLTDSTQSRTLPPTRAYPKSSWPRM